MADETRLTDEKRDRRLPLGIACLAMFGLGAAVMGSEWGIAAIAAAVVSVVLWLRWRMR